jgi:short-subunit dehydrogenase
MKAPACILITGASGGIGSAMARAYAGPGTTLILHGRDEDRLRKVADSCRARGAEIQVKVLDVTDTEALRRWVTEVSVSHRPDLVIVNCGITSNIGDDGRGEDWEAIERVVAVNLTAALATAHAVVPMMRQRGHGQIAFVSSLSAYFGLPMTPSYCASKAALKSYAEAWRGWLTGEGIGVTVICPGFVESAMSRRFPGPTPFLVSADKAARLIRRQLQRNPARISFPFPLNFGMWWLAVLPPAVSLRVLGLLGFGRKQS